MSDLVSRLLAAIEETEQAAQACGGAPWVDTVPGMVHVDPLAIRDSKWTLGRLGYVASADNSPAGDIYRRHIAHNDPAAVLRRCTADRKLLELHAQVPTHDGSTETGCKLCLWEYSWGCDIQEGICDTVKIVAEGYGISVEEETTGE